MKKQKKMLRKWLRRERKEFFRNFGCENWEASQLTNGELKDQFTEFLAGTLPGLHPRKSQENPAQVLGNQANKA